MKSSDHDRDSLLFVERLRSWAKHQPSQVVLRWLNDDGKSVASLTRERLDDLACRVAGGLYSKGLKQGDCVMLCYPPGLDFIVGYLGCLYAGIVAVPVYPPQPFMLDRDLPKFLRVQKSAKAEYILTNGTYRNSCRLASVTRGFRPDSARWPSDLTWLRTDNLSRRSARRFRESPPTINPSDLAFLQFTSGSTSDPKGVMLTHGNITDHNASATTQLYFDSDTVVVSWCPQYHDLGLIMGMLLPLHCGGVAVLMSPISFIKAPSLWPQAMSEFRATHTMAPTFAFELIQRKVREEQVKTWDLSKVRMALIAAEPVRPAVMRGFSDTFAPCGWNHDAFCACYGLAENVVGVTNWGRLKILVDAAALEHRGDVIELGRGDEADVRDVPVGQRALHSSGLIENLWKENGELYFVDPETCREVPHGKVGEIWLRTHATAVGYWGRDELSASTFAATMSDRPEKGVYLRTGDLGFLYEKEVFITGRLKDLIIIRGRNLYPQDVELTVENAHANVRPGCVAAVGIERGGDEHLVVIAELRDAQLPPDIDEVVETLQRSVRREHEISLHALVLVKPRTIPKTTSGKIRRHACRNGYMDRDGSLQVIYSAEFEDMDEEAFEALDIPRDSTVPPSNLPYDEADKIFVRTKSLASIRKEFHRALHGLIQGDEDRELTVDDPDVLKVADTYLPEVCDALEQMFRDILGAHEPLDHAQSVLELGFTSITMAEVTNGVGQELEVSLPVTIMFEHRTIRALATYAVNAVVRAVVGGVAASARIKPELVAQGYDEQCPVLIVGGGPVGLALSASLSKMGVRNIVAEAHPAVSDHPKATVINTRSMEVFRQLGVAQRIQQEAVSFTGFKHCWVTGLKDGYRLHSTDTSRLIDSPVDFTICAQDSLEPILAKAAEDYAENDTDIRFSTEVTGFYEHEGAVYAELTHGDGNVTIVNSDWMVACDGASSPTRGALNVGMLGSKAPGYFLSVYFHGDLREWTTGEDESHFFWVLQQDHVSAIISVNGSDRWVLFRPLPKKQRFTNEECAAMVQQAVGEASLDIQVQQIRTWEMTAEVAARYRIGSIFLCGDAAHHFPPTKGLGLNTGIQDAHNLAWKLAAVVLGQANTSLLSTYGSERRPFAETNARESLKTLLFMEQIAQQQIEGLGADSEAGQRLRDELTEEIIEHDDLLKFVTNEVDISYPSGAFVPHEDVGDAFEHQEPERYELTWEQSGSRQLSTVRHSLLDARNFSQDPYYSNAVAGDRAPHIPLTDGEQRCSTLDLFDNQFTLLISSAHAQEWLDAAEAGSLDCNVHIKTCALGVDDAATYHPLDGVDWLARFGLSESGAVLVRPDGHIAWKSPHLPADAQAELGHALRAVLGDPDAAEVEAAPLENHFAESINGIRMHYVSSGVRGEPLMLFLHGFPEFWHAWRHQLPHFGKQGFYCVAPDLRGYNLSDRSADDSSYIITNLCEDVAQLIDHLGYEDAIVVGHDWGAILAWSFATDRPEMVRRLIVASGAHPVIAEREWEEPTSPQSIASAYIHEIIQPGFATGMAQDRYQQFGTDLYEREGVSRQPGFSIGPFQESWSLRGLDSLVAYYRANHLGPKAEKKNFMSGLLGASKTVDVPTLLLWGKEDVRTLAELAPKHAAVATDLRVEILDGVGHFLFAEVPEQANGFIESFVASELTQVGHLHPEAIAKSQTVPLAPRSMAQLEASGNQRHFYALEMAGRNADAGEKTNHHLPVYLQLFGEFELNVFESSIARLFKRHEVLRTTFDLRGARLTQHIWPSVNVPLTFHDLSHLSCDHQTDRLFEIAEDTVDRPFEFVHRNDALARFAVVKLHAHEHVFLGAFHHIISDAFSLGVFRKELTELYRVDTGGENKSLQPRPFQYLDYAVWLKQLLGTPENMRESEAYLQGQVRDVDLERPLLPTDHLPKSGAGATGSAMHSFFLDDGLAEDLVAQSMSQGVTFFMTILAAFETALANYSEQERFVLCVPTRHNEEGMESLFGPVSHVGFLRAEVDAEASLAEMMMRCRGEVLSGLEKRQIPENISEKFFGRLGRHMCAISQLPPDEPLNLGELQGEAIYMFRDRWLPQYRPGYDLYLYFVNSESGLRITLAYNSSLLEAATVEAIAAYLRDVLTCVAHQPDMLVGDLVDRLPKRLVQVRERTEAKTVAVSSTFTSAPIAKYLDFWAEEIDFSAKVAFAEYNQVLQTLLDPSSLFGQNADGGANVVLVSFADWLRFKPDSTDVELRQRLTELRSAVVACSQRSVVPLIVGICPCEPGHPRSGLFEEFGSSLAFSLESEAGVSVLAPSALLALTEGRPYFDEVADREGHVSFTDAFFASAATVISRTMAALMCLPYKVIVVDCDNTLWRGVVGEDGVDGIVVTDEHRHFHEFLVQRHAEGMLICLCSKNDEADVLAAFEYHADSWALKREHLVSWRINWESKAANIASLASELSLGLDSFIFIDDNPVECATVRAAWPDVLVLPFGFPEKEIPGFLGNVWAFDRLRVTAEDSRRTEMYQQQIQRTRALEESGSLQAFYASLNLSVEVKKMASAHVARVSQLTRKTNQFNFSAIRRSEAEVRNLADAGLQCRVVDVSDRFGAYGLVGVLICSNQALDRTVDGATQQVIAVDSMMLSCRVLGKGVEHRMLVCAGETALSNGASWVEIVVRDLPRNTPARDFVSKIAQDMDGVLRVTGEDGTNTYHFPAKALASLHFEVSSANKAAPTVSSPKKSEQPSALPTMRVPHVRVATELRVLDAIVSGAGRRLIQDRSHSDYERPDFVAPRSDAEVRIAAMCEEILGEAAGSVGVRDRLYELGLTSLGMVQLISALHKEYGAQLIGFDNERFYDDPTVAMLAGLITPDADAFGDDHEESFASPGPAPLAEGDLGRFGAGVFPVVGLVAMFCMLAAPLVPLVWGWELWCELLWPNGLFGYNVLRLAAFMPGALLVYNLCLATMVLIAKRILIGRYQTRVVSTSSWYFARWWFIDRMVGLLFKTGFQHFRGSGVFNWFYRLMGAQVGSGAHIESTRIRDFDLVTIGAGAFVGVESTVVGHRMDPGVLVFERVRIGAACRVAPRAIVTAGATMEDGSCIAPLSVLEAGAVAPQESRIGGSPARRLGHDEGAGGSGARAVGTLGAMIGWYLMASLLSVAMIPAFVLVYSLGDEASGIFVVLAVIAGYLAYGFGVTVVAATTKQVLIGRQRTGAVEGAAMLVRYWFVDRLLDAVYESFVILLGHSGLMPVWLRLLGARVGEGCTLNPFRVRADIAAFDIGAHCFFGGELCVLPSVRRYDDHGQLRMELVGVRVGDGTILGNRTVLQPGVSLGSSAITGDLTVADIGQQVKAGAILLGSPAIVMGHRSMAGADAEVVAVSERSYSLRHIVSIACVALSLVVLVLPCLQLYGLAADAGGVVAVVAFLFAVPAGVAAYCGFVAGVKWLLVGKLQPGRFEFRSSYYQRYVLVGALVYGCDYFVANLFRGTWLMRWWFRMLGAKVADSAFIYGFSTWDADLVTLGERAVIGDDAYLQGHDAGTGAIELGPIVLGDDAVFGSYCVCLPNVTLEDGAVLRPMSSALKGARFEEESVWRGNPAVSYTTTQDELEVSEMPSLVPDVAMGTLVYRNLRKLFRLYDVDCDARLKQSDYQTLVDRFAVEYHLTAESEEYQRIHGAFMHDWNRMAAVVDQSHGEDIQLSDWVAYHRAMLSDYEGYGLVVGGMAEFLMTLLDRDGDGSLILKNYSTLYRVFGMPEDDAQTAFESLDRDGDGRVSHEEFVAAAHEFFHSADPEARGHWLMGNPMS